MRLRFSKSDSSNSAEWLAWLATAWMVVVCLVVVAYKIDQGIWRDQTFHIAGLYRSLRDSFNVPHLDTWNYRPLVYRAYLAGLAFFPVGLLGWTEAAAQVIQAVHLLGWAVVYFILGRRYLGRQGGARGLLAWCIVFASNCWSFLSADELAGLLIFPAFLVADAYATPPSKRSTQLRFGLVVGVFAWSLLFLKGITVLFVVPLALHTSRYRIVSYLRPYVLSLVVFGVLLGLTAAFTRELSFLHESATYRIMPWSLTSTDLERFWNNTRTPWWVVGVVVLSLAQLVSRRRNLQLVTLGLLLAVALFIDAVQGRRWAYHLAPVLGVFATSWASWEPPEKRGRLELTVVVLGFLYLSASTYHHEADGSFIDRDDKSVNGKHRWALADVKGISDETTVLYIAYGLRFARHGFPYACDFFSVHPLNRVDRKRLEHESFPSTERLRRCILDYEGEYVFIQPKFARLERNGYDDIIAKLCTEYHPVRRNVLKRGPGSLDDCPLREQTMEQRREEAKERAAKKKKQRREKAEKRAAKKEKERRKKAKERAAKKEKERRKKAKERAAKKEKERRKEAKERATEKD